MNIFLNLQNYQPWLHRKSLLKSCRKRWFNPRTCRLVDSTRNITAVSRDTLLIKICYGDDEEVELNQEISLRDLITRVARRGTPPIIPAAAFRGALPDRKPDRQP
jgi:hypothetical protein